MNLSMSSLRRQYASNIFYNHVSSLVDFEVDLDGHHHHYDSAMAPSSDWIAAMVITTTQNAQPSASLPLPSFRKVDEPAKPEDWQLLDASKIFDNDDCFEDDLDGLMLAGDGGHHHHYDSAMAPSSDWIAPMVTTTTQNAQPSASLPLPSFRKVDEPAQPEDWQLLDASKIFDYDALCLPSSPSRNVDEFAQSADWQYACQIFDKNLEDLMWDAA